MTPDLEMNEELALCAKMNFENLERAFPAIRQHPFYVIAKAQLDESLGGKPVEEVLAEQAQRGGE